MASLRKSTYSTLVNAEEQHLSAMSTTTSKTSATKVITEKRSMKKTDSKSVEKESKSQSTSDEVTQKIKVSATEQVTTIKTSKKEQKNAVEEQQQSLKQESSTKVANSNGEEVIAKKKTKTKKSKKSESGKENISVKSSFSKFDALQNAANKGQVEKETSCRLCEKPVYKMEEIKAEKSIYHKNCFRCHECSKQLKVDNYQSYEGVLYCLVHFKLLFAPKYVEDTEPQKPRKPELIIRENQPIELPPDVARASDKPDLGLEELQQINVRSRFQVFENAGQQKSEQQITNSSKTKVNRTSSILSKMAKLQAHGVKTDLSVDKIREAGANEDDDENVDHEENDDDASDNDDVDDDDIDNIDLVRSRKRIQRERPVGLTSHSMNDIKTRFEKGHNVSKEERREERKQEIQNIRSRLFMGKQARIKEMYQQAVADSEQAITSVGKQHDVEVSCPASALKERFEKGDMFKDATSEGGDENIRQRGLIQDEADVFESGISKQSRSIFLELDANVVAEKNKVHYEKGASKTPSQVALNRSLTSESEQEPSNIDVVKYDENPTDVEIKTSEISQKFKFFETYRPSERQKKEFRITPPRDGVVKMPSPEGDADAAESKDENAEDAYLMQKSQTTALMLNKFREMEQMKSNNGGNVGPRPLKCFTPPPDGGKRLYEDQDSDVGSEEEDDDDEDDYEDEEKENGGYRHSKSAANDEALREAQAAARAKQLRAKFEKWEANEIQRELDEGRNNGAPQHITDDTIESTKSIRERFESMKAFENKSSTRPRHQVKRFV